MLNVMIAVILVAGASAPAESVPQRANPQEAGNSRLGNSPTSLADQPTRGIAKSQPDARQPSSADDVTDPASAAPEPTDTTRARTAHWRTVADDILNSGAIGELRRGGFFMWPILLLGIVAAGVILERWRSLKMVATDSTRLRQEVSDLLQTDRVKEALARCDTLQGPVPAVLAIGLRKFLVLQHLGYDPGQVSDQVVRSMDDYSVHIVAALERHLPILATVSSVAPMLGFLGTVQGMVVSFREIVERMGETNIVEAAATGINIALLTTVFGLIVGIPTYIAYNYFTSVINGYVLQVEESATELIESVTLKMALERGEAGGGP